MPQIDVQYVLAGVKKEKNGGKFRSKNRHPFQPRREALDAAALGLH